MPPVNWLIVEYPHFAIGAGDSLPFSPVADAKAGQFEIARKAGRHGWAARLNIEVPKASG
jgi:hypothetical protein